MAEDSQTPLNAASGLPVAPSLAPALASVEAPPEYSPVDQRVVVIAGIAVLVGIAAALLANVLTRLIGLITNVAYYGRVSTAFVAPSTARLAIWPGPGLKSKSWASAPSGGSAAQDSSAGAASGALTVKLEGRTARPSPVALSNASLRVQ